jgi:sodium transport system permease protein
MRAILAVMWKEVRENLRERRTIGAAFITGPVLVPAIFALMLNLMVHRTSEQFQRPLAVAIVHAERAPNLVAQLREQGVTVRAVDYDDAKARAALAAHRDEFVLVVPSEFGSQLASGSPAPVQLYADSSDVQSGADGARLRALLSQYSLTIAQLRLAARGIDPLLLAPIAVQSVDVATPASRSLIVLGVMSYFILVTMLLGGLYLAIDATAGERERGSLEPLLTVPVRREYLIYGKILAACAFMLASLILTVTALAVTLRFAGLERIGFSANFGPVSALGVIAYCAPFAPLGAAMMTLVAAATRTYREAQTYVGLVLLVPTLPLAYAGAVGLRPTTWLMAVPSLSQHFLITGLVSAEPVGPLGVALSVLVTLAVGIVLMRVAGRLYRREALLG